ncbi:COG2 [Bugula neritina]|uniref:COG2 n=1 Tax=Bugula neritina TaxID=10212 RepID=A0A7J7JNP1_BUGNE|nr:COG2 [Bugula neritina]
MKHVSDIPRLYRRTNKEVPTKSSGYTNQAIQMLGSFKEQHNSSLPDVVRTQILTSVITSVIEQYEETTCEVLLSVKKMEDSLKRLKRGKTSASLVGNMSDDDKIRTQILLDVQHFSQQVRELGMDLESIPSYSKLVADVEQSLPARESPSPTTLQS